MCYSPGLHGTRIIMKCGSCSGDMTHVCHITCMLLLLWLKGRRSSLIWFVDDVLFDNTLYRSFTLFNYYLLIEFNVTLKKIILKCILFLDFIQIWYINNLKRVTFTFSIIKNCLIARKFYMFKKKNRQMKCTCVLSLCFLK